MTGNKSLANTWAALVLASGTPSGTEDRDTTPHPLKVSGFTKAEGRRKLSKRKRKEMNRKRDVRKK